MNNVEIYNCKSCNKIISIKTAKNLGNLCIDCYEQNLTNMLLKHEGK